MSFKVGDKVEVAPFVKVPPGCVRRGEITAIRSPKLISVRSDNDFDIRGLWESDLLLTDPPPAPPDLRESLADVSHDIWSSWISWMFTVGTVNEDGTWTMPATLVERWHRQMETPYSQLSEREKDSDREQAGKIMLAMGDE